jgi:hypothetical protein
MQMDDQPERGVGSQGTASRSAAGLQECCNRLLERFQDSCFAWLKQLCTRESIAGQELSALFDQ